MLEKPNRKIGLFAFLGIKSSCQSCAHARPSPRFCKIWLGCTGGSRNSIYRVFASTHTRQIAQAGPSHLFPSFFTDC